MASIFEDFISSHVEIVEEELKRNVDNTIDTLTGADGEESDDDD